MSFVRNVAICAVVCLASATPALAANPPAPAIAQYVETFPSAEGANVSGFGKPQVAELPKPVAKQVEAEAGADAAALTIIATSSQYGAPQAKRPAASHAKRPAAAPRVHRDASEPTRSSRSAAPASLSSGGGSGGLVRLLVILAVVTAGIVVVGRRSRAAVPVEPEPRVRRR